MFSNAVRPITLAADHASFEFHEVLLGKTGPIDRLLLACAIADQQTAENVLDDSPDIISTLTADDAAFISDAAWENRIDPVRTMLDMSFNIDAVGMDGGTALERAAVRGWTPLVQLLIDRGASLEIQNKYGGNPLGAAIWGSENWPRIEGDHIGCLFALIAAGSKMPNRLWGGSPEVQELPRENGVVD